jgi:mRNA-degrading endonuclease toxin of MazEF toxin-antitoxin module
MIVSVDQINRAPAGLVIVCPIKTTPRDAAVRIELPREGEGGSSVRVGYVEPYQIRTVSQERLVGLIGKASSEVRDEVAARIALFTRSAA